MAPPSSGGITIGEALNILSAVAAVGNEPRAQALFQYLEASRLAFADRNAYIGDTDYVDVPQHGLLDPDYAATRRCLIHATALHQPGRAGQPVPALRRLRLDRRPRPHAGHEGTTPTTSSSPTSGATSSATPTRSSRSPAAASPCPGAASCSTTR